jgi:tetratricopeptide (TPR) repeat protein
MRFLFTVVLLSLFSWLTLAQGNEDRNELFDDGEYFFARGDYKEAAYYFRQLANADPRNCNYNFKLGECYMNLPGSEQLAIPCFEIATKGIVEKKKYRLKDSDETNAPLHAWFYLGNVYRIAGRLDDALNAYQVFINSPFYYENYNANVVENEIRSCERAKIIMDSPVEASIEPLDTLINTLAVEIFPVVSADETTLVFVRRLKFYDAILCVVRQGNKWGPLVNLNPLIGSDGDFYPVGLSHNGNILYLVKNNPENKDLYFSTRKDDIWAKAEPLGRNINTISDETWASVSEDGQTLWFTSARKGGWGGLDIYFAHKDADGQWMKAKNAGKLINTPFDEESPCICDNGRLLFFSSKGHYSMGGFDIFYTSRVGKNWKEPVNIGYPINNTSDNSGYVPVNNCRAGYYSLINSSDGYSEDVYKVILKSNYPLP